ncbi:MAG: hypothetical protein COU31_00050 [Candidatus Magasanikbacteria bacterium CG10_big_fil_rev_8_21_14_0_10_40_10]|uniref:Uncharacterized protein n=1 Tax=Candidatus Magasanikbacteria bacterium CG10_big_fil_rev_8_21_14_0_10_40_10 TaxID=1974648 RepID=A0A2M6W5E4_9BACT|nr:MAG: hypothetical protein COU31_00050 [Candidatus Magasanikbacteria bacterium CG10_big_fil_rev_8_21_14_0_10_40_10]
MGRFNELGNKFAGFLKNRKAQPSEPENQSYETNGHPYRTISPEDMAILQRQEVGSNFALAESIMNRENYQGYMGPEQVKKAFGIDLDPKLIPEIPFSQVDLEKARELGQFLVLRVDKAPDGQPLTMEKMENILQPKFDQERKGRVFWKFLDRVRVFFKEDAPSLGWALTSKEVIPGSIKKNYLVQTQAIAEYLQKQVFPNERDRPQIYKDAIAEFEQQQDELAKLMKTDWKKAAKRLSELKINQLCRQTANNAMYDTSIHFQNTGKRLLERIYTWTKSLSPFGRLVGFGRADSWGAGVFWRYPANADGDMGVVFSRSQ